MMKKEKVGSWAFVLGLIIAVGIGLFGAAEGLSLWILAFLGLVVGLLNVTHSESMLFLVASITFIVSASSLALIIPGIEDILTNVVLFVGPSAAVVALRALYDIGRSR